MLKEISFADFKSGFLIFLIALPLCLGIAMASSFPPIAGIFTAIIGGLVVSFLGSARLTIKGPAAGLIVVILGAVQELGGGDAILGYKRCLAVGVAAALLQILFSQIKAGKIGQLVPVSVIHGMLAAIGVVIIAKQFHVLLGVVPHGKTPIELITEIPISLIHSNPRVAFMGVLTLCTIFLWPFIPNQVTKKVPPALIALFFVLPLVVFWHLDVNENYTFLNHTYELGPKFLVSIPKSILDSVTFPDFSALSLAAGWKYVIMLALVGSLESLLTVMAMDNLDPKKRSSNLDRDLLATGIGNLLSSCIGGLPMISEVVRSKANIDNGAKSAWSNFFHGVFLLLAVTLIPTLIHEIPLSALAAMLIITGFRLASPREFYKTYKIGSDQLILFVTTLIVTLATDLLIGVLSGLMVKVVLHLIRGAKVQHLFKMPVSEIKSGNSITLQVKGAAIFTNYLFLRKKIEMAKIQSQKIIIDFSSATVVDHTTLHHLHTLADSGISFELKLIGLDSLKGVSTHEFATRRPA